MLLVMSRGFSDEAIVVMKQPADENMATYLRVKLDERARMVKTKGGIIKVEELCIKHRNFKVSKPMRSYAKKG